MFLWRCCARAAHPLEVPTPMIAEGIVFFVALCVFGWTHRDDRNH